MGSERIRDKVAKSVKKVKEGSQAYDGIGEEIEKEFGPQGPYFGPRIDNRKPGVKKHILHAERTPSKK